MESVSPNLYVNDLQETTSFYHMLGFKVTTLVPEEGPAVFAMMENGGVTFMFQTFKSIENMLPEVSRVPAVPFCCISK
jgi:predicted lactoylglutathione lyase